MDEKHYVIRVGKTHHGDLKPDALVIIPASKVKLDGTEGFAWFVNPLGGGTSYGMLVDTDALREILVA